MRKSIKCGLKNNPRASIEKACLEIKSPKLKHYPSKTTQADLSDESDFAADECLSSNDLGYDSFEEKTNNGEKQKKRFCFQNLSAVELQEKVGQGSFGDVHRAVHVSSCQQMAVKIIHFDHFDVSYQEQVRKLFEREKEISIAVQQNSSLYFLAEVFGAFQAQMKGYILNQFLDGCTLQHLLEKEDFQLTEDSLKFLLASLLLAIQEIHQNLQCIHRDIKPSNIMILPNGKLKLIDLGAAKFLLQKGRTSSIVGTCLYFSPERLNCKEYGKEADLWSFAVIAYELVKKELPFTFEGCEECYDQEQILRLSKIIRKKKVSSLFEDQQFDEKLRDLLEGIFSCKDAKEREEKWSIENIKKSSYFSDFPWPLLQRNKLQSPILLDLGSQKIQKLLLDKYFDSF